MPAYCIASDLLLPALPRQAAPQSTGPDGIIVHRRTRAADEQLVHDIRCRPGHQAQDVYQAITQVWCCLVAEGC